MPVIILVRPQMGENIGAAARVMMNFGFSELRIVAPRDGWPNAKAVEMAVHAAPILERAKIFDDLESAIGDMNHVAVTTARDRDMEKPVMTPREYAKKRTYAFSGRRAIVFGPERSGLTNDEIALADLIIAIPVADSLKSLNLAQAVAVVCYEVFSAKKPEKIIKKNPPAEKAELLDMFKHLEDELQESGFFPIAEKKPGMVRNIRNMFSRLGLTGQEIRTMRGVIRSLSGTTNRRKK